MDCRNPQWLGHVVEVVCTHVSGAVDSTSIARVCVVTVAWSAARSLASRVSTALTAPNRSATCSVTLLLSTPVRSAGCASVVTVSKAEEYKISTGSPARCPVTSQC